MIKKYRIWSAHLQKNNKKVQNLLKNDKNLLKDVQYKPKTL